MAQSQQGRAVRSGLKTRGVSPGTQWCQPRTGPGVPTREWESLQASPLLSPQLDFPGSLCGAQQKEAQGVWVASSPEVDWPGGLLLTRGNAPWVLKAWRGDRAVPRASIFLLLGRLACPQPP